MAKVARNESCPCGSGKKYKHCCIEKPPPQTARPRSRLPLILLPIVLLAAALFAYRNGILVGLSVAGVGIVLLGIIMSLHNPPPSQGNKSDSAAINFGGRG